MPQPREEDSYETTTAAAPLTLKTWLQQIVYYWYKVVFDVTDPTTVIETTTVPNCILYFISLCSYH